MTYDHAVKVNGKWFKAGEDITASLVLNAAPTTQETVDTDEKKVEQEKKPATPKRSYTKRK